MPLQTWKDHSIPELYQKWAASWSTVNDGWLHIIWSDEDNRQLIQQHYPSILQLYESLPLNICRVDMVKSHIHQNDN